MAPQRTVFDHRVPDSDLRKPLLATSCAADRKIRRSCRVLFTDGARSATINHNNLETCELPALILGTRRGGFESEFLLRERGEAMRQVAAGAQTVSATLLEPSQSIHNAAALFSLLHQAIADLGHPCSGCWHYTRGRKE